MQNLTDLVSKPNRASPENILRQKKSQSAISEWYRTNDTNIQCIKFRFFSFKLNEGVVETPGVYAPSV